MRDVGGGGGFRQPSRPEAQSATSLVCVARSRPFHASSAKGAHLILCHMLAAMLSPTCHRNATFRAILVGESVTPLCVQRFANVRCRGDKQLRDEGRSDYLGYSTFDEHWTKLNVLNLTGLRGALHVSPGVVPHPRIDSKS